MRIEDVQTLIVTLFDNGKPVSEIAETMELPYDFVSDTVIEWWQLMDMREWEDVQEWVL